MRTAAQRAAGPSAMEEAPVWRCSGGLRRGSMTLAVGAAVAYRAPAGRATCGWLFAGSAEAVGVETIAHAEALEARDLAAERARELRQGRSVARGTEHLEQRACAVHLGVQHQLLRPGQFGLDELDVVVGELGAAGGGLDGIREGA